VDSEKAGGDGEARGVEGEVTRRGLTRRWIALGAALAASTVAWPADARVLNWFEDRRGGWLDTAMLHATNAWTIIVFLGATAAWLLVKRRPLAAAALLAGTGVTAGIGWLIKITVNRPRPYSTLADFVSLTKADDASFPSNHTSTALAAALLLSWWFPALRAAWLAFAGVVAVSRLYVGVHFLSDVCAGAALALLVTTCGIAAVRARETVRESPEKP
jgi:undecaprenyl-diphosphatase